MVGGQDDYKIDDGWISHYARLSSWTSIHST